MKRIRIKAGFGVLDPLLFALGKHHGFGGCFTEITMGMLGTTKEETEQAVLGFGVLQRGLSREGQG